MVPIKIYQSVYQLSPASICFPLIFSSYVDDAVNSSEEEVFVYIYEENYCFFDYLLLLFPKIDIGI